MNKYPPPKIILFKLHSEYSFLSNKYKCLIQYKNFNYDSAESLYKSLKEKDNDVIWMQKVIRLKFRQNTLLREKLWLTGTAYLQEDTDHKFWAGTINTLGKILMNERDIFEEFEKYILI